MRLGREGRCASHHLLRAGAAGGQHSHVQRLGRALKGGHSQRVIVQAWTAGAGREWGWGGGSWFAHVTRWRRETGGADGWGPGVNRAQPTSDTASQQAASQLRGRPTLPAFSVGTHGRASWMIPLLSCFPPCCACCGAACSQQGEACCLAQAGHPVQPSAALHCTALHCSAPYGARAVNPQQVAQPRQQAHRVLQANSALRCITSH